MIEDVAGQFKIRREESFLLLRHFLGLGKKFLLRSEICEEFEAFCARNGCERLTDTPIAALFRAAQEATLAAPWFYLAARRAIGRWEHWRIHAETLDAESVPVSEYLAFKEELVDGRGDGDGAVWPLEIDLGPFRRGFPRLKESRSIGHGVSFLNRHLSSQLFKELDRGDERLLEFLRVHRVRGQHLMLNDRIRHLAGLRQALEAADEFLAKQNGDRTWGEVADPLRDLGFEPGWGKTASRARETLRLLSDLLEAPDPSSLEEFLSRIPMIFSLVVLSPHGYFGQSGVLGLPDTGGQVVYILDQVRALEEEMRRRTDEQGIEIEPRILVVTRLIPEARGTTCDRPRERIAGTQHATIMRVPFRDASGEVIPQWISRFEVWPYLERFAAEAEKEALAELGGRPDLILGNYSDGCLVASLMARSLGVTQCNIAHALEKTKYLFSDLYWRENDAHYHFGCQFSADLISMNMADFIITSTYQEIAGTGESVGQYESYGAFTMPGLYRVVDGVDVYDPKFNVVSPGADPNVCFPFSEEDRRLRGLEGELKAMVLGEVEGDAAAPPARGRFEDPSKPILFTMARLDRIKNLNGLVDWYGRCPRLRESANLLVVGGHLDPEQSDDAEERDQILRLHGLIDEHDLEHRIRWVGFVGDRNVVGELYRFVADRRGAFVQPALFEAYGLTVVEAMTSGLPTFATKYGGPSEIIEAGVSGFHIDPNHGEAAAAQMAEFFERCAAEPAHWDEISRNAIQRIRSRYTWQLYAARMMTLARIYGFWKYVTNLEREETRRYLEMLYALEFRRLAAAVPH